MNRRPFEWDSSSLLGWFKRCVGYGFKLSQLHIAPGTISPWLSSCSLVCTFESLSLLIGFSLLVSLHLISKSFKMAGTLDYHIVRESFKQESQLKH